MNILSFVYWNGCHDTSAAIICDGELVAAAEEERFSRRKHDGEFPVQAIEFCLRQAGLRMSQVDCIAFAHKPFRSGRDSYMAELDWGTIRRMKAMRRARSRSFLHKLALEAWLRVGPPFNFQMEPAVAKGFALLREHFSHVPPVRFYNHHLTHAAATYYTSGFEDAAIATIDGVGGPYSTVTWSARENRIRKLRDALFPNSLGFYYRDCTRYLGLGDFGEGKTMGLAAYGEKETYAPQLSAVLDTRNCSWYQYLQAPCREALGFPARTDEPIVKPPYPDFAAAAQDALERAVHRIVRSAVDDAQCANLCLSGGVTLNCSSNGAVLSSGLARSVWLFPAAGDAGVSVGAALLCAAEAGQPNRTRLDHAYWGPQFSPAECEAVLRGDSRIFYQRAADVSAEVARSLAAGEVVGWFQGRMELGPRALGNRSILADPRTAAMRDRVNKLKGREAWRPLAPVVVAERAAEYFDLPSASPFMLFATAVRPEKKSEMAGVVHADGTARPQTVTRRQNPRLYDLISAFARLTGLPVLLNTSFNAAGDPIVCSPADSLKAFFKMGLDVLVLGDYVARRRDALQPPPARASTPSAAK